MRKAAYVEREYVCSVSSWRQPKPICVNKLRPPRFRARSVGRGGKKCPSGAGGGSHTKPPSLSQVICQFFSNDEFVLRAYMGNMNT